MSRFIWLIRREIWEHKAIWVAPAGMIACLFILLMIGRVHLGDFDISAPLAEIPQDNKIKLHQFAYASVAFVLFLVMGVICFFYSIDSLYADRRDRSVLFWKSLPLSDAETVLSKFAVAAIIIPVVAMLGAVLAQLVVGGGLAIKLAISGGSTGLWWHPEVIFGGAAIALIWCVTAMLWYAPLIAYLMLASAWAPKGPFLWAVLPPVAAWVLERVVMRSEVIGDFIFERLFGMYMQLGVFGQSSGASAKGEEGLKALTDRLASVDLMGRIREFYGSPELWLGVVAAGLLLAATMWVRRYRDETA
jgi:ABC-2 type transport system permease protein